MWIAEAFARKQNAPQHVEIDVIHLHNQYVNFCIMHRLITESFEALESTNWDYFSYGHRQAESNQHIFFSGVLNPSHDLNGVRLNNPKIPIVLVSNIFTRENRLEVLFGCPTGLSKTAYAPLVKQILDLDEIKLFKVLNNIMTLSAEKPLLGTEILIDETEIQKIDKLKQQGKRTLDMANNEVLDLLDRKTAVEFIRSA